MKPNEMMERYVYAVTKRLPQKIRADVAQELKTLIDDMLEARCAEMPPTEQDVRMVLTELGAPAQLAQKYDPDQGKSLISGEYFVQYKLVLKVVLICVVFGTVVAGIVTGIAQTDTIWYMSLASGVANVLMGVIYAFAFVTFFFAIFSHNRIPLNTGVDALDNLPEIPKTEIPRSEPIFGIVMTMVFVTLFLGFPGVIGFAFGEGNSIITLFNETMMRQAWIWIVAIAALGILRESVRLIEGHYSRRVMVVTIVTEIVTIPLAIIWLLGTQFLNPAFLQAVAGLLQPTDTLVLNIVGNAQLILLGIIVFATVLDIATTVYKTLKAKEA